MALWAPTLGSLLSFLPAYFFSKNFPGSLIFSESLTKLEHLIGKCQYKSGLTLMDACWVSQSVFYEVLNEVSDEVFLKEGVVGNGEIMFHSAFKKGYWKSCFIRSERIDTSYCQVQDWENFVYVSITKHPF